MERFRSIVSFHPVTIAWVFLIANMLRLGAYWLAIMLFVGLSIAVHEGISYCGWRILSDRFPLKHKAGRDAKLTHSDIRINDCLMDIFTVVGCSKDGIVFKGAIPYCVIIPAILIPWNDVEYAEIEHSPSRRFRRLREKLLVPFLVIRLKDAPEIDLKIRWSASFRMTFPAEKLGTASVAKDD